MNKRDFEMEKRGGQGVSLFVAQSVPKQWYREIDGGVGWMCYQSLKWYKIAYSREMERKKNQSFLSKREG